MSARTLVGAETVPQSRPSAEPGFATGETATHQPAEAGGVAPSDPQIDAAEALRADLYALLGTMLSAPPRAPMLAEIARLEGGASEVGKAVSALAKLAGRLDEKAVEREYNVLFIGLGRGALLPYGSYYLTGFLHEKPLALLRSHMAKLGIGRQPEVKEPEDHIASLCEMMAGLIRGVYGHDVPLADQEAFFNSHIAPWAGHFFSDLEGQRLAVFYAPVGRIGRLLMDIEFEAFAINA